MDVITKFEKRLSDISQGTQNLIQHKNALLQELKQTDEQIFINNGAITELALQLKDLKEAEFIPILVEPEEIIKAEDVGEILT